MPAGVVRSISPPGPMRVRQSVSPERVSRQSRHHSIASMPLSAATVRPPIHRMWFVLSTQARRGPDTASSSGDTSGQGMRSQPSLYAASLPPPHSSSMGATSLRYHQAMPFRPIACDRQENAPARRILLVSLLIGMKG